MQFNFSRGQSTLVSQDQMDLGPDDTFTLRALSVLTWLLIWVTQFLRSRLTLTSRDTTNIKTYGHRHITTSSRPFQNLCQYSQQVCGLQETTASTVSLTTLKRSFVVIAVKFLLTGWCVHSSHLVGTYMASDMGDNFFLRNGLLHQR